MIMLIATLMLIAGYAAGRLHGKAAALRFIAEGFRIMERKAIFAGQRDARDDEPLWSAEDISDAFGTGRWTE